jgi:hypothetical protein
LAQNATQQAAQQPPAPLSPRTQAVLDRISANSLRGHLSFIASDLLEGRGTPSRGLDLAAEYIAAQFRRTGLEPAGNDSYYQTAELVDVEPVKTKFELKIDRDGRTISIARDEIAARFSTALDLSGLSVYKIDLDNPAALGNLKPADIQDKAVVARLPDFSGATASEDAQKFEVLEDALRRTRPKLTLLLTLSGMAELDSTLANPDGPFSGEPVIVVRLKPESLKWYESLRPGANTSAVTLRMPAATEGRMKLRNVIGLLRGSDAVLKNTYVLVTAHYDHLGMKPEGTGDRIFNGANDDGSGTVSVIELAAALATLQPRPKRSLVFLTFFGEEEGTLGSLYYARHPVFPLEQTVADVNLEQIGRTDALDGRKLSEGTFTGFDYSDLPRVFQAAGAKTGVRVLSDRPHGDSFFARSDNAPLAEKGVPAHTFAVAFEFPDYHSVGDKWQKIDYDNMARVDQMLALGLILLANDPQPPMWNQANPKAERYVEAWRERHATR